MLSKVIQTLENSLEAFKTMTHRLHSYNGITEQLGYCNTHTHTLNIDRLHTVVPCQFIADCEPVYVRVDRRGGGGLF